MGGNLHKRTVETLATGLPVALFALFCMTTFFTATSLRGQQEKKEPPPGGPQPPAKTGTNEQDSTKKQPTSSSTSNVTDETKALLTSPDARLVAVFKCASFQTPKEKDKKLVRDSTGCPLETPVEFDTTARSKRLADVLAKTVSQPLKDGQNRDTDLAKAIAKLMSLSYRGERLFRDKDSYALVHLVDRQGAVGQARDAADETRAEAKKTTKSDAGKKHEPLDRWILARRTRKGITLSEQRRLMGAKAMQVIFVHVNATVLPKQEPIDVYGDISYRAVIKERLPLNLSHLLGLLQVIAGLQASAEEKPVAFMGFGPLDEVGVPSDVTVFAVEPDQAQSLAIIGQPGKFDNEGNYWWDVSVAVPVNKLSLLDYSEQDKAFLPETINKQSVYGLVNVFWPMDLKSNTWRSYLPRAAGGLGLTGRPGETLFIGGTWGIPQLQFFVGSAFANHRYLPPGADPSNGASYKQRYSSRLTYGINIPVVSAIKKLTSKKDDGSTAGGTGATGGTGGDKGGGKKQ